VYYLKSIRAFMRLLRRILPCHSSGD